MTNQHNPIAQLITKIQQKWAEEVSAVPSLKLIRWLIDPQQSQLYEGFLKLESSPHGTLPEIFVTLLTPFHSMPSYSHDLIDSWFETFDKDKSTFDQLESNGHSFDWDDKYYRKLACEISDVSNKIFLDMLASFHTALNMPDRKLTIVLFPHSITNTSAFGEWLKNLYKAGIPENIQFCIFDSKTSRFYDNLFSSMDSPYAKSVMVELDLAGAINKSIQAGDPNDPGIKLQKYIQTMSEAVSEKNLNKLQTKGNECIEAMTRSKVKSLMATSYLVYAGMLFSFRRYTIIEDLLDKGMAIANAGKNVADIVCHSLLLQFYNFKASNYQLDKKHKESIDCFCKSAEISLEISQPLLAISAYTHAAYLSKKHDAGKYREILEKGYNAGRGLTKEELSSSEYLSVSLEYYNILDQNRMLEKSEEVDDTMKEIFGSDWKRFGSEKSHMSKPITIA